MSHNNYDNHPRSSRPSHTSGDSHSGSLSTHGDSTMLDTMSGTNSSPYPVPQRSTSDLTFQRSAPEPALAQDINATIPNCPCQTCSDAQRSQPTWYPNEERDTQQFGNAGAPYVDQDQSIDNGVETASIAPARSWAPFVPPQPQRTQDSFGHAPVHDRAGPSNMSMVQTSTLDTSIAESRRRLAASYLNNADAYVSMILLEPGSSGRLQVIITLETTTL